MSCLNEVKGGSSSPCCAARQLVPGLLVAGWRGDSCVTLNTRTKEAPIIDNPLEGLVVAGAGSVASAN